MRGFPRQTPPMTFGPGPMTPAVKVLIIANVVVFVLTFVAREMVIDLFGLSPADVLLGGRVWQPMTYLFVH